MEYLVQTGHDRRPSALVYQDRDDAAEAVTYDIARWHLDQFGAADQLVVGHALVSLVDYPIIELRRTAPRPGDLLRNPSYDYLRVKYESHSEHPLDDIMALITPLLPTKPGQIVMVRELLEAVLLHGTALRFYELNESVSGFTFVGFPWRFQLERLA